MNTSSETPEYHFIDRTLIADQQNRTLFDWSPMAIVIINQQGTFLDANNKLYEWLGYKPEEVIGKHLNEMPFFTDETKQIIIENFTQRISGRNIAPYEVEFVHKNGEKRWGEIHGVLLKDTPNNVVLDLVMVSDITERKETFEQLQQSEQRYRYLFENATDLIQSVNKEGRFIAVNPQWLKMMEYSQEEVDRLSFTDILRKDQIPHCQDMFQRICRGETLRNVETVFVSKTGKEIVVEGNISAYFYKKKFTASVGIFRDISDKKRF